MDSKQQGYVTEQTALQHLQSAGLALVERNFSSKYGEIDLVMTEADVLVFVEVRYRKSAA